MIGFYLFEAGRIRHSSNDKLVDALDFRTWRDQSLKA